MAEESSGRSRQARSRNPQWQTGFLDRILVYAGFAFSFVSAGALVYGVFLVVLRTQTMGVPNAGIGFAGLLAAYSDIIAIAVFAAIGAVVGLRFFAKAGRSTNFVIRPEDREALWPLISAPKVEAVDQYIRLASLSGFSGAFTKVGFTGLPLATVTLTLIFILLSLVANNDTLMEFAKLTLGAFIGSFVQRQVERGERQAPQPGAPPPQATSSAPRLPV